MEKFLITSALPYINGVKHLGNLVGSILPADVYAKFLRQSGKEVLFICGTDEHGTPAEIAAQESSKPIEKYCLELHETQKRIYEEFGIEFDFFGRSSSQSNHRLTKEIFVDLDKNGYLKELEIQLFYSEDDCRFLPDRYIEGECPKCSYVKARGDQCDKCGSLLDPKDLLNPVSTISKSKKIELKSTKHFFLDLSKIQPQIEKWVNEKEDWPGVVKGIAKKWLSEGLRERCITRDLKWGIKVPYEGYEEKVFYVWFDAPNAYISITKDWATHIGIPEKWKEWWLTDNSHVRYTQFMAKDNVPFHSIFWPAVLFASGEGFKQVDYLKGFHWLTYEKGKFSTSQKRGIFTDRALELYPSDYWRYYLLSNCPETSDADFSFYHFASIVNKDLADILGNFMNRTISLFEKYCDSSIRLNLDESLIDKKLKQKTEKLVQDLSEEIKTLKFRRAAQTLRSLWVLGNEYITEKQPWTVFKTDTRLGTVILVHCIHLLRLFAIVSYPFIPFSSEKILTLLNDPCANDLKNTPFEEGLDFSYFPKGHVIQRPEKLFEKIENSTVNELTDKFAGISPE